MNSKGILAIYGTLWKGDKAQIQTENFLQSKGHFGAKMPLGTHFEDFSPSSHGLGPLKPLYWHEIQPNKQSLSNMNCSSSSDSGSVGHIPFPFLQSQTCHWLPLQTKRMYSEKACSLKPLEAHSTLHQGNTLAMWLYYFCFTERT